MIGADDYRAAVRERQRNVIVTASAGTGKTRLVVERVIEMLAPSDGGERAPIERIAVITFTRKAAGELRVRIRQRILEALATADDARAGALRDALAGLDAAHIGTVHSFAERLLRRFAEDAGLDPGYEVADDVAPLVAETLERLLHSAERGTVGEWVSGALGSLADEAAETLLLAQRSGIAVESVETEFWTYHGLGGLFDAMIAARDVPMPPTALVQFQRARFVRFADEYLGRVAGLATDCPGGRWLQQIADALRAAVHDDDPAEIYARIVQPLGKGPRGRRSEKPTRRDDFGGSSELWDAWNALVRGDGRPRPLRDDLLDPLREWLACRLARIHGIVLHVYEHVKARHRVVDQIDLLLRLRDLLRDNRSVRVACHQVFQHIFVDEFQDTDPLQAEIILLLTELSPIAARAQDVEVAPGMLTMVGDEKQSIYRFRRADLDTYRATRDRVARAPHVSLVLSDSYRSVPALVDWINERFGPLLVGSATYQPLIASRTGGSAQPVRVVPFELPEGGVADAYRALEGEALARYVRWLVQSELRVEDRATKQPRPVRFDDIAVLAVTTTKLPLLFAAFDRDGIPYAARGGTLFLDDPLHRQFLLGLCALAEPDDGVAMAALLQPPFFALGLADLARDQPDDAAAPSTQARAIVDELRRARRGRSAGATARALAEETSFARSVALAPNGLQRLANLREVVFAVERHAAADGLDFDAAMADLRAWVDAPARIDPPHPVGVDALSVLTIHQAKGLEFPVVVLWDGRCLWSEQLRKRAFEIDRNGRGWSIQLEGLDWAAPPTLELAKDELERGQAERRRLLYVAATRARDYLVLPCAGAPDTRMISHALLGDAPIASVHVEALHRREAPAPWFAAAAPPEASLAVVAHPDEARWADAWAGSLRAAVPRIPTPLAVTASLAALDERRAGRLGPIFGDVVHRAIGAVLRGAPSSAIAVARAIAGRGIDALATEAVRDVDRAIATLRAELPSPTVLRVEYAVAARRPPHELVGSIDLVAARGDEHVVIDFKTDQPPGAGEPIPERYAQQLREYVDLLGAASARAGVLYTADGAIRWL